LEILVNFASLLEQLGEPTFLALGGILIGLLFGFCAHRSQFCLRAAILETKSGPAGEKLSVWLLTFGAALFFVQLSVMLGAFNPKDARQFANVNSLSGALLGGFLFGIGMVMTRACAGRMVVLAAGGNLRALLSGLVFAVTAQATIGGILVPLRNTMASWWRIDGANNYLLSSLQLPAAVGPLVGLAALTLALVLAYQRKHLSGKHANALGVSLAIALGWWLSYAVSKHSFEPISTQGLTFSLPSAEWLTRVTTQPGPSIGFDFGLLPGVVAGAFLAAITSKTFRLEGFQDAGTMLRYVAGAILMGFGAILAGGCSIGAAVTGSAILAITAVLALAGMVVGALVSDTLLQRRI
jgi:uncharacterized membrane protein YedE/YeeE